MSIRFVGRLAGLGKKKMRISEFHSDMGFRDLKTFNMDLLAKQGWRPINDENSLLFKVYKLKYFPNS